MQNLCNGSEFDLHEIEPVGGAHIHMNGFS